MVASRLIRWAATVLVSGTAGWVLNEQWPKTSDSVPLPDAEFSASTAPAPDSSAPSGTPGAAAMRMPPPVQLFADGTVTVNVQNRPVQWVLDEITRLGGLQVGLPQSPVQEAPEQPTLNAPQFAACKDSPGLEFEACQEEQARQSLRAISEGDEKARYESLAMAGAIGLSVPQETLKTLYETDTSERVRLLAFEQYIDGTQATERVSKKRVLRCWRRFTPRARVSRWKPRGCSMSLKSLRRKSKNKRCCEIFEQGETVMVGATGIEPVTPTMSR